MKKLLLLIVAFCFIGGTAFSQISVGARVGPGISNLHGQGITGDKDDPDYEKTNKSLVVPHFGVFGNYNFGGMFSAQVELNYAGKGCKVKVHDDGYYYEKNISLSYLEIPILAMATFGEDWPVQVFGEIGPYIGFNTGARFGGNSGIMGYKYKDEFKTIDFGFIFGAGGLYQILDNLGVFIDLRYALGLVNIDDSPSTDGDGSTNAVKTGVFNIDFGAVYKLGK